MYRVYAYAVIVVEIKDLNIWCVMMMPLLISPGPANIATANVSTVNGFRAAVVFACGITVVNCIAVSLMGLGMGLVYVKYHTVFWVLEQLGAIYVIYLGITILRTRSKPSPQGNTEGKCLGFRDALLLQALNTKLYPILTMMFSQFIDAHTSAGIEVLQLSALLVGVAFANYIMWAWLGVALGRAKGSWAKRIQRYGFGSLLALVGLWLLIH